MDKKSKIYLAGHTGMVGSAILRNLQAKGYNNIVTRTREELDLTRQSAVEDFFKSERPEIVIIAAAKVGGILANDTYRAQFISENLIIQNNIIHTAYVNKVKKLLFLGSSCIYPKNCPQPMKEEYLLTGSLEPTNEPYAIAKIAGIKLCENYYRQYDCNFLSVMPTNMYGPNDNYDPQNSHVLPALIRKFYEGKITNFDTVILWGTGKQKREFIFVDDTAEACVFLLENIEAKEINEKGISHLNIGTGNEYTVEDLAKIVARIVGFKGSIAFDNSKPDGVPRKLLDSRRILELGWYPRYNLKEGLTITYKDFVKNQR